MDNPFSRSSLSNSMIASISFGLLYDNVVKERSREGESYAVPAGGSLMAAKPHDFQRNCHGCYLTHPSSVIQSLVLANILSSIKALHLHVVSVCPAGYSGRCCSIDRL